MAENNTDTFTRLAPLFGGVGSAVGSVVSGLFGRSNAKEAFENQKELMRIQQQYAVDNWNRENAYNTPAAQLARLKAAGLNPNLMYGNGSVGVNNFGGSIDAPSAPSAPMAPSVDFSSAVGDAVNAAVGMAQAKKAGSETIRQDIENKYLGKQMQAQIESTQAYTDLSKENKAKISMECGYISGQCNQLQKLIEGIEKDNEAKGYNNDILKKQASTIDRRLNAELSYLESSAEITKEQKEILKANKESLIKLAKGQADLAETTAMLLSKYGDVQAVVGIISQVVSSGLDIFSAFHPAGKVTNIYNTIKNPLQNGK